MVIVSNNKKPLLDLLLYKWKKLIYLAAIEGATEINKEGGKIIQASFSINLDKIKFSPSKQINYIKNIISQILPEVSKIDTSCEELMLLNPDDYIELYINHHTMCIHKVLEIMEKEGMCLHPDLNLVKKDNV